MVNQAFRDAWNTWTDNCSPQEFMNLGRATGHSTIGAAVDAYVIDIQSIHPEWAGLNAEELEDIRDVLMSYLFVTRSIEWF